MNLTSNCTHPQSGAIDYVTAIYNAVGVVSELMLMQCTMHNAQCALHTHSLLQLYNKRVSEPAGSAG